MFWYFVFFFASGFCGLLYELIWLRLAMARFGVTTALTSMVLSSFMAGLGTGSLAAGRLLRRHSGKISFPALRLYALVELLIACSAIAVPLELTAGHNFLAHMASAASFSSASYYVISGIWVALTLIPWCACMRPRCSSEHDEHNDRRSDRAHRRAVAARSGFHPTPLRCDSRVQASSLTLSFKKMRIGSSVLENRRSNSMHHG